MIELSRNVSIPDHELEITAIRAQGAGGQHVKGLNGYPFAL